MAISEGSKITRKPKKYPKLPDNEKYVREILKIRIKADYLLKLSYISLSDILKLKTMFENPKITRKTKY